MIMGRRGCGRERLTLVSCRKLSYLLVLRHTGWSLAMYGFLGAAAAAAARVYLSRDAYIYIWEVVVYVPADWL